MVNEILVSIRNWVLRFLYVNLLKPVFFLIDPENMHDAMILTGRILGNNELTRKLTSISLSYQNKRLEQNILGVKFPSPVGLSAGFDKNALLINILPSVGFGFAEVGTITGEKCAGNPKPRLWRLIRSKGLVVYYGLKNDGAEKISARLKNQKFEIPIFTSIGKTNNQNTVKLEAGINDYIKAYREFTDIGHFFDINISCPNVFGGQPFSDPQKLDKLLFQFDKIPTRKPVFIKMPPDLTDKQLGGILNVVEKHKIAGFVCSNLAEDRRKIKTKILDPRVPKKGGISGKVVEDLANDLIRRIYQRTRGKYVIIGVGGISSAKDAYKKIKLGASLVELITGMIFEGPQVISEINQGLVKLLKKDCYKNISQAIGKGNT